jgi:cob(I)alamin adenosyltransferase
MKIYTRTGDTGDTGLLGGVRVSKGSPRVDAYGEVDELNAALGSASAEVANPEVRSVLEQVQRDLFSVGALLADPKGPRQKDKISLAAEDVERLEECIDRFESKLPSLTQFILPGGSPGGALLHQARSVCRRAERKVVALAGSEPVASPVMPYLNRLSDLLFVLARFENQDRGVEEKPW